MAIFLGLLKMCLYNSYLIHIYTTQLENTRIPVLSCSIYYLSTRATYDRESKVIIILVLFESLSDESNLQPKITEICLSLIGKRTPCLKYISKNYYIGVCLSR